MGTKSGSSRPGQAREESWGFGVRRDGTKEKGVKETPIEAGEEGEEEAEKSRARL